MYAVRRDAEMIGASYDCGPTHGWVYWEEWDKQEQGMWKVGGKGYRGESEHDCAREGEGSGYGVEAGAPGRFGR